MSGKCSSSWNDAIAFARSYWYSPSRRRMLPSLQSELRASCKVCISVRVSLCCDNAFHLFNSFN